LVELLLKKEKRVHQRAVDTLSCCFDVVSELFAGSDCTSGASVSASAAVEAGVGIDRIDVAFLDSVGGAY